MIRTFRHKGLERFFFHADRKSLDGRLAGKIGRLLDILDAAAGLDELRIPSLRLHELGGNRQGTWSIKVSGNWRITFRFMNGNAHEVNFEDYH